VATGSGSRCFPTWCGVPHSDATLRSAAKHESIAPSPRPAHRTGRADFPHPALGQGLMRSPTGALACSAVCSFRTVRGVVRFTPISRSCATSCARLEPRPLPSTPRYAGLRRYYEPLRHPIRPDSGPRGPPVGGHAPPPDGASRVAFGLPVHACRRHYPGGAAGRRRSSCPTMPAFPESHRSASTLVFSRLAQRLLTLRPACSPGRLATLSTGGFSSFVTSTTAPIATGWSDSCQAGIAPAENRRLLTAHGTPHLPRLTHRLPACVPLDRPVPSGDLRTPNPLCVPASPPG
jgi:hypothetical protein